MKLAAKIFAILGALAIIGLGVRWVTDYNAHKQLINELSHAAATMSDPSGHVGGVLAQLRDMRSAGVLAVLLGAASLIGLALIKRRPRLAALVFVVAAIVPAVFAVQMLLPGALLFVAAGLAIGASFRRPAVASRQPALALAA